MNNIQKSTQNIPHQNLILGIDPGYDRVGVSIIAFTEGRDELVFSTCIETDKKTDNNKRIANIAFEIDSIIKKYNPICMGIESLFLFKNHKTVIQVSEARGVIKYIAEQNNIKIIELTPMQVKSSVAGDGHASKTQVEYMVRNILRLGYEGKIIDDEVDAMAIALTTRLHNKAQNL
ncbi:MAG: crossover junction endodeoxyribonuclease RuvC [Patescibacteria group bacterium]|nr:crossover junction endodeoxyribonuclease RuvC [Patescibacteria group bacterium]